MQTDATLLANNSQNCWMWHLVSVCTLCCMSLRKVWYRSNFSANNSQHFFCSMIAEAWCNNVGSVCTALPTLLGPHMLITHGLQRLMGCILPTMHCRSQHCWELFHPFAHHCQHTRNNSQHCWEFLCLFACSLKPVQLYQWFGKIFSVSNISILWLTYHSSCCSF